MKTIKIKDIKIDDDKKLGDLIDKISNLNDEFSKRISDIRNDKDKEFEHSGRVRKAVKEIIDLFENYSCSISSLITELQYISENNVK